jgi:hypothetical protein
MRRLLGILLVAWLAGCSDDGGSATPDAATGCAVDGGGAFGDTCTDACGCASGVCHQYGDGTRACTLSCTMDSQCPAGSEGMKCNNMGVCRI